MSQLKRRDEKPSHTPGLAKARPLGGGGGSDLGGSRKRLPPHQWLPPQYRLQYPFWFSLPTTTCKFYLS